MCCWRTTPRSSRNGERPQEAAGEPRATVSGEVAHSRRETLALLARGTTRARGSPPPPMHERAPQKSPPSWVLMPAEALPEASNAPTDESAPHPPLVSSQKSPPSWVLTPTGGTGFQDRLAAQLAADDPLLLNPRSPAEANSALTQRTAWVFDHAGDDAWSTTVVNGITMARPAQRLAEPAPPREDTSHGAQHAASRQPAPVPVFLPGDACPATSAAPSDTCTRPTCRPSIILGGLV